MERNSPSSLILLPFFFLASLFLLAIENNLSEVFFATTIALVIFAYTRSRNLSKHTLFGLLLMWFARVALAYFDSEIHPLPGSQKDSTKFYFDALIYLDGLSHYQFLSGSAFFKVYLSKVYGFFGAEMLKSNLISAAISMISLIYFLESLLLFSRKKTTLTLLILGFSPSFLVFSTTTMREPYLAWFILQFVFFTLYTLKEEKPNFLYFSICLISSALLPILHIKAFFLYSIYLCIVTTIIFTLRYNLFTKKEIILVISIFVTSLCVIALSKGEEFLLIVNGESPYNSHKTELSTLSLDKNTLTTGLDSYLKRTTGNHGEEKEIRTFYATKVDFSLAFHTVSKTIIVNYIEYMFSPAPWQIGDFRDLIPLAESLGRLFGAVYLLFNLVTYISQKNKPQLKTSRGTEPPFSFTFCAIALLICLYLGQSLIWSIGTTNYGQAFRHHVTSNPILLLTCYLVLSIKTFGAFKNHCKGDKTS